jgi:hypothetical protein
MQFGQQRSSDPRRPDFFKHAQKLFQGRDIQMFQISLKLVQCKEQCPIVRIFILNIRTDAALLDQEI